MVGQPPEAEVMVSCPLERLCQKCISALCTPTKLKTDAADKRLLCDTEHCQNHVAGLCWGLGKSAQRFRPVRQLARS